MENFNGYSELDVYSYKSAIKMVSQQKRSVLGDKVMMFPDLVGEKVAMVEWLAQITAKMETSATGDTEFDEASFQRRWITSNIYTRNIIVPSSTSVYRINDPKGSIVTAVVAGFNRAQDEGIIKAFKAPSLLDKLGNTKSSFNSSTNTIAASYGVTGSTAQGINLAKLELAHEKLLAVDGMAVQDSDVYVLINAKQQTALFRELKLTNRDYVDADVIATGKLGKFLGMNIIVIADGFLPKDADDLTSVFVWDKSAMGLGIWKSFNVTLDRLPTKKNATGIMTSMVFGATRLNDAKVFEIKCK